MKSTLKRAGYKALHRQMNDVHLQYISKVAFFIITMFSLNLFFAGHYTPGGGFVGGLLMSSAVLLLLIAYDVKTLKKMLPIPLKLLISLGLLFAIGVPFLLMVFGNPFFTHALTDVYIPLLGDVHIHSAVFFDLGVFLVVFGATILILIAVGGVKD
ncbi:Na(+)/H(+) antiporter subunit B [Nosocomiicoccus massiliensis]|uniref:Na(+)/H(+) antiporter subunit B n=1 Tax=Nosocomiicoccus massiliensis TaxID=1232430 RepID=A0AAF0YIJ2_9STAP|nr:Na(+)/H(+) antiporter subunit B [Nosocomiicoccus massiliensis]WOS96075.1 Na(+)/H(+) antiporter subunit B [Nosocomiicoccus massiliensis]